MAMDTHRGTARARATQRRRGRRLRPARRRGIASVLAMLYLLVFASLAVGFYAQVNIAAQVSRNERHLHQAQVAAESGWAFMRHELRRLDVYHVPENELLTQVFDCLWLRMAGTGNLADGVQVVGKSAAGDAILIPKDENAVIPLGNGTGFRCKITRPTGRQLVLKVTGYSLGGTGRGSRKAIEVDCLPAQIEAPLLSYGMAARGPVEIAGGGVVRGAVDPAFGSVLVAASTSPTAEVTVTGTSVISGDVYLTKLLGTVVLSSGASIGGTTEPALRETHIHKGVPAPDFPVLDTAVFAPHATNTYTPGLATYNNIRVPAGANPTFGSGVTINGVCYIETPNVVTFSGDCVLRGVIASKAPYSGGPSTNVIDFKGKASAYDASSLPPEFGAVRGFTGSSVVTPGFHVKFSGGYAAISGTLASSQLSFSGQAGGAITGHVVGVDNQKLYVGGNSEVILQKPAKPGWPAGIYFRSYYVTDARSYREVLP